jgi:transcriptional regulator with XRE-family HTH domain
MTGGYQMDVGQIIRRHRKDRKMTLLELSRRSGVALATLSRMENGKMTGTIDSHMNICKALEISLPDLYSDLESSTRKVGFRPRKAPPEAAVHARGASSEILAPNVLDKKMMPIMIRIARGSSTHFDRTKPGVEKFIYLLEGKIEAALGERRYSLSKGDTLYFESSVEHRLRNTGPSDARLISVTCPPVL